MAASGPSALKIDSLDRLVGRIPHDLFAARRWFRSKGRPIAGLALEEAAPLVAHPATSDAALVIVRVSFADDGEDELYLLPMVEEPGATSVRGALEVRDDETGMLLREPRDGDGVWRRLAAGMAAEMTLPGLHGAFAFHALGPVDAAGDEHLLRGEQSNTSVALGATLLKLYRRLELGENPDLEMPRFLSQVRFDRVPRVQGFVRYLPARGEPSVVAMLQAFLADAVDGWRWLLNQFADGNDALDAVARIGEITAELHRALASRPEDAAFPARSATSDDRAAWRASAERQLEMAVAAAPDVAELTPQVRAAFDAFEGATDAAVSRIHGDYHLGQLLRSGDDFWVIDFEGEPARPLVERRQPSSPLRDVAGMLRSLDYAARTAERERGASVFEPEHWLEQARHALLQAYRSGGMPVDDGLLRAFELEKACYEVHYEANNRPDWVWLPLAALRRT
jgi:trehalose synthase-fused probable maltokinase